MKFSVDEKIVLGSGLFGSVLHGTLDSVTVAVKKCIHKPSVIREADFLKLCEHPNVVKYIGLVELLNKSYLVLEILQGGTLQSHLGRNKFGTPQKASFVRQLCLGLQHIHSKNILHCDIKAENLLFRENNQKTLVIVDFGMAEKFDANSREANTHDVVRDEIYTFKSDIYLLGLVVWQIFRDSLHFNRTRAAEDIRDYAAHNSGPGQRIIPKREWEIAIVRSVHKRSEERPPLNSILNAFKD